MGIFEEVRIGIAQCEISEASPSRRAASVAAAREQAQAASCDLLVLSGDKRTGALPELIALGDTVLHGSGNALELECAGRTWKIALGADDRQADVRIVGTAQPWTRRDGKAIGASSPLICANPVGMTNAGHKVLAYDGASFAIGENGVRTSLSDRFEEDFVVAGCNTGEARAQQAPISDKTLDALVKTMRRFDQEVLGGRSKWVIGLSGGLDSSVVAALLTIAFGPDRVVGYNLATRYNSLATRTNADKLASALGIAYRKGSIEEVVEATRRCAEAYGYDRTATSGLVLENIQARVRGHMLSTFAATEGGVVANNGNRIECALGYATLYGDAIGALAPIADLTKVELFDLARAINASAGRELVSENLLPVETEEGLIWDVAPSAELSSGQRDPMKWFYHDWLISELLDVCAGNPLPIMESYRDESLLAGPVGKWVRFYGLDDPAAFMEDLEGILKLMQRAAFKRIQAPPAIAIASRASVASGDPRQGALEIPEGYNEVKGAILAMRR